MPGMTPATKRSVIDTPTAFPYMTNATLGGIITPIEPAQAVIAQAKPPL